MDGFRHSQVLSSKGQQVTQIWKEGYKRIADIDKGQTIEAPRLRKRSLQLDVEISTMACWR